MKVLLEADLRRPPREVAPEDGLQLGGAPRFLDRGVTNSDQLHQMGARSRTRGDPFHGSLQKRGCLAFHYDSAFFEGSKGTDEHVSEQGSRSGSHKLCGFSISYSSYTSSASLYERP